MSDFNSLPEECIAHILSLTSPQDVCRSSAVSRGFLAAANSNNVWKKFLPEEYDHMSTPASSQSSSAPQPHRKKDAYFHLCRNPVLIEGGLKSLSLEKCSGKKCLMIGARNLYVVWGDTPEYWIWSSLHASRFSEVAELRKVCWLEVHGRIETQFLSPNTQYGAYFIFKFTEMNSGFENQPVDVSVLSGQGGGAHTVFLDPDGKLRRRYERMQQRFGHLEQQVRRVNGQLALGKQLPSKREDGWMEVELGEFFTNGADAGDVSVKLMEVKSGNWKSGLVIHGVEFRPYQNI